MISRRRRSTAERNLKWSILVPVSMSVVIENHLWDPIRNKPKYGSRNEFVLAALREKIEREAIDYTPPRI